MEAPAPTRPNPFQAPAPIAGGLISVEQQRAIAEVQAAMVVARSMPRSVVRAESMIMQECSNPELAEEASYAYNRGGTEIEAPSIRLAETMARHWGNMKSGVRELERHEGYSVVQAYAQDLETGYMEERTFQVKHWRDTKQGGYPITDERDIYENNANQGARRKRACILAMIPMDIQSRAMKQCATTLAADGEIPAERVQSMLERFAEFKVTREMIEKRIGRTLESVPAVTFIGLQRIFNSLRDRISTVDQWFEVAPAADAAGGVDKSTKGRAKAAAKARKAERAAGSKDAAAGTKGAPTVASVVADIEKSCALAEAAKDADTARTALADAQDLARALEGKAAVDANNRIAVAKASVDGKFPA